MTRIWAAMACVAGVLLALDDFHIIRVSIGTLWPLVLIAAGASMLVVRTNPSRLVERFNIGSNTSSRPRSTGWRSSPCSAR